jgi:iron complex outermembrane recepter protein
VIDSKSDDIGLFLRTAGEGKLFGRRNETVIGVNAAWGTINDKRFVNVGGSRGAPTFSADERAANYELYGENRLYVRPDFAVVLGAQATNAERISNDRFLADGDDSGDKSFAGFSPKLGPLWQLAAEWQAFGNISRSFEAPTFAELNPTATPGFADL